MPVPRRLLLLILLRECSFSVNAASSLKLYRDRGGTDIRRLNAAYLRTKEEEEAALRAATPRPFKQPYQSFLCFDVEATCEPGTNFDYPNEIIVSLTPTS